MKTSRWPHLTPREELERPVRHSTPQSRPDCPICEDRCSCGDRDAQPARVGGHEA